MKTFGVEIDLSIYDKINNAADALERARDIIMKNTETKEIAEGDMLLDDIEQSLQHLVSLEKRIEFALMIAVYAGQQNAKRDFSFDCDNSDWCDNYISAASNHVFTYDKNNMLIQNVLKSDARKAVKKIFDPFEPRQISIIGQDFNATGDLEVEDDHINATYELWFDVDKYFGEDTRNDEEAWINLYTNWYPDGTITASYNVCRQDRDISKEWPLTDEEKQYFKEYMELYCKEAYGKSLDALWRETHYFLWKPSTINNLCIGDIVKDTLQNGVNVDWIVTEVTDEYVRFEAKNCIDLHRMNDAYAEKSGIAESEMHRYLNEDIFKNLSDELQSVISETTRKYCDGSKVKEFTTKLFLPSASEVFDKDECYGDAELYKQLEYYKNRGNLTKKYQDISVYWWLSSLSTGYTTIWCLAGINGCANTNYATYPHGVAPCFIIKKA